MNKGSALSWSAVQMCWQTEMVNEAVFCTKLLCLKRDLGGTLCCYGRRRLGGKSQQQAHVVVSNLMNKL